VLVPEVVPDSGLNEPPERLLICGAEKKRVDSALAEQVFDHEGVRHLADCLVVPSATGGRRDPVGHGNLAHRLVKKANSRFP
jgi:hypothetical protein